MTMFSHLGLAIFLSLSLIIHAQRDDERDLPPEQYNAGRSVKASFDTQFPQGRCPDRFFQVGDECLYFSTEGKIYAWREIQRVCSGRVARMINQQSASNFDQPNMTPEKGVRQLTLNTPEKTEILRGLFREYNEQNFAVKLPADFNSLQRCRDGRDDRIPSYCSNLPNANTTCLETTVGGANEICLGGVECNRRQLRAACEFTLPGSPEITSSKFRQCTKIRGLRGRLPLWAWITIGAGSALLLFIILAVVCGVMKKSKNNSSPKRPAYPEPYPPKKVITISSRTGDSAEEPMLVREAPAQDTNTGYLQPRRSPTDNTVNA